MSPLTQQIVKKALSSVVDPDSGQDVVSAGMISGIAVHGNKVGFVVTVEPADKNRKAYLRDVCEQEIKKLPGVESVTAVMTAQGHEPIPPKPQSGYDQP